jgi:D-alanyl-D-alanine carboxypeptidase/D-alanyl-D-alanine-endopeptidase (penicillin-binding protein 4)
VVRRHCGGARVLCGMIVVFLVGLACIATAQATDLTRLQDELTSIIQATDLKGGTLGIRVEDVALPQLLYDQNGDIPLKPASCNKLQTSAAALYYLGSGYTYTTRVYYSGQVKGKKLVGDLVVVGSGDPTISGRFQKNERDVTRILHEMAKDIRKAGIKVVTGDVIGDDDYFDDIYFGKGWYPKERAEWYSAEVSALSFNDNCIDILWKGARKPGRPAKFTLNPETDYVRFVSHVTSGEAKGTADLSYTREDKSNSIVAKGSVPAKQEKYDSAAIYNPTLYFVTVFHDVLRDEGVKVQGKPRDIDTLPEEKKAELRERLRQVSFFISPPMSEVVKVINRRSQNFYAEQVLKTLGAEVKGKGSFGAGVEAVQEFLHKEDIYKPGNIMIDGSGLSYLNRVSAHQLVDLMRFMNGYKEGVVFFDSLPRGGQERASLSTRFRDTPEEEAVESRILGKTGYIGGVHSLTGMVTNAVGKKMFYSIIVNDFGCTNKEARDLIDRLVVALASSKMI